MKQPTLKERQEYMDIVENSATVVPIKGTKKSFKIRWMHPYTIERITRVWIERDLASVEVKNGSDVAKDLCQEPYFAFKEAALMILNNDIKIRLFYWFYWRWLAFRYTEGQMVDVIAAGKKKLPLTAHYEVLAYSLDTRQDLIRMTAKEAEQYRAERDLAAKRLLSKTSPDTESQGGGSFVGSGISVTGVS